MNKVLTILFNDKEYLKSKIKPLDQENICNEYKENLSSNDLANKYNCSQTLILKILKFHNIEIRDSVEARIKEGRVFNKKAFTDFNSEEDSYFYGLLLADGFMNEKQTKCSISLKSSDINILEELKKYLICESKICKIDYFHKQLNKKISCVSFHFSGKDVCKKLVDQGFEYKKSLKEKSPMFDHKQNRHFWRGMIDGDGSISYSNNGTVIGLCGSFDIISSFKEFVENYCSVDFNGKIRNISRNTEGFYEIRYYGKNAKIILLNLYGDCNLFLQRKKSIAEIAISKL